MHFDEVAADYICDFTLIGRRTAEGLDARLFELHFIEGHEWPYCSMRLGINRGNFFHRVYRVKEILGRAYAETEPYPLYPLDRYFARRRGAAARPLASGPGDRRSALRPPVRLPVARALAAAA